MTLHKKLCPINSIMCFISIFISGHFESLGVCPPSTKNRGAKKIPFDRKTFDSILIWWRLLLPIKNSRNIEKCSKISRLISFFAIYSVSNENPSDWESNFLWFFVHFFARLHFFFARFYNFDCSIESIKWSGLSNRETCFLKESNYDY